MNRQVERDAGRKFADTIPSEKVYPTLVDNVNLPLKYLKAVDTTIIGSEFGSVENNLYKITWSKIQDNNYYLLIRDLVEQDRVVKAMAESEEELD